MESLHRFLEEIVALDPELRGEAHAASAEGLVFRMVREVQRFGMIIGEVGQHQPERIDHAHAPRCTRIEFVAHAILEHAEFNHRILLADPGAFPERADRSRWKAAPARSGQGRHARIVPAVDQAVLDQGQQLALAHHGEIEVAAGELDLLRTARRVAQAGGDDRLGELGMGRQVDLIEAPVIQRPVVLELERAQRMGDALDRIRNAVRIVVHRIDRPGIAGVLVGLLADPVDGRVTQVDVAGGHVDLRSQGARPIGELAGAHALEQVEVLGHAAVAERRIAARFGQGAAVGAHCFGIEVADEGLAVGDQLECAAVEHLEVVRGMALLGPFETEPVDVLANGLDEFDILARRIGIVEAQVAGTGEIPGDAEIQTDALGVAQVQVAVRLGRKTRVHLAVVLAAGAVGADDLANEVCRGAVLGHADPSARGGHWSIGKFSW